MPSIDYINFKELLGLIAKQNSLAGRFIVAICGPPGSGKSTIAGLLVKRLGQCAKVVPMDGFHLDNRQLKNLGLLHRKGAPETFDAFGFLELVKDIRRTENLSFPVFDRDADKTIMDADNLGPEHKIIIVEGNYLLLKKNPWSYLKDEFDLSVCLEVSDIDLEKRLTDRWIAHGLDPISASARALSNDMTNVRYVKKHSILPDYIVAPI